MFCIIHCTRSHELVKVHSTRNIFAMRSIKQTWKDSSFSAEWDSLKTAFVKVGELLKFIYILNFLSQGIQRQSLLDNILHCCFCSLAVLLPRAFTPSLSPFLAFRNLNLFWADAFFWHYSFQTMHSKSGKILHLQYDWRNRDQAQFNIDNSFATHLKCDFRLTHKMNKSYWLHQHANNNNKSPADYPNAAKK